VVSLILFILIAGLMGNELGIVIGLLLAAITLILDSGTLAGNAIFIVLLELLSAAIVAYLYVRFATVNRNQGTIEASEERLKLAEITSRMTRAAAQREPMQVVLDLAIQLILEKYPQFYHAQVFLIDENGVQARLAASSGAAGKALLERNHALAVGSLSVIGQVTLSGVPVIEEAGTPNSRHRFNDLLPNTRTEMAFPLRTENDIIGALDVQSQMKVVFSETDLSAFQALADSLSLVIDNVRQFENARLRIHENQRLADQARNALREVERLNKRLIGRAWGDYLRGALRQPGLNVDFEQDIIENDNRWTPTLADAAASGQLVQAKNVVAMPLRVRGQVIGAMEFELPDGVEFEPEDIELVQEIGDRFGLTAENTRLVEESQRIARREAMINEVSARLQVANNVEATMTEAARSLREVLQAHRVVIRLGTQPRPSKEGQP
jgi:GAF domain-containing protein